MLWCLRSFKSTLRWLQLICWVSGVQAGLSITLQPLILRMSSSWPSWSPGWQSQNMRKLVLSILWATQWVATLRFSIPLGTLVRLTRCCLSQQRASMGTRLIGPRKSSFRQEKRLWSAFTISLALCFGSGTFHRLTFSKLEDTTVRNFCKKVGLNVWPKEMKRLKLNCLLSCSKLV